MNRDGVKNVFVESVCKSEKKILQTQNPVKKIT